MIHTPKPTSLTELMGMEFKPTDHIVSDGILNKGSLMFLGGPPKSYKSFILGSMVTSLATGAPLLDRWLVSAPQRILMIEQEIGWMDLKDRYSAIRANLSTPTKHLLNENLFFLSCDHSFELSTKQGIEAIRSALAATKPDILALDPLVEFHHEDENSSKDMMRVMHNLDAIREDFKLTIIITHHVQKGSWEDPRANTDPTRLRGSSSIFAKGDSYLMVDPGKNNTGQLNAAFTLRRGKPIDPFSLRVNFESLTVSIEGKSVTPSIFDSNGKQGRVQ